MPVLPFMCHLCRHHRISTPAGAGVQNYPWCAIYSDGVVGGSTNCGFTTFEQCTEAARGLDGFCRLNPQYQPPS
jgi:hypothetical protein